MFNGTSLENKAMTKSTLTFPGASIAELSPEEEIAHYLAAQELHLAVLVQRDGIIHTRVTPNLTSANEALHQLMTDHGRNLSRAFVRPYGRPQAGSAA